MPCVSVRFGQPCRSSLPSPTKGRRPAEAGRRQHARARDRVPRQGRVAISLVQRWCSLVPRPPTVDDAEPDLETREQVDRGLRQLARVDHRDGLHDVDEDVLGLDRRDVVHELERQRGVLAHRGDDEHGVGARQRRVDLLELDALREQALRLLRTGSCPPTPGTSRSSRLPGGPASPGSSPCTAPCPRPCRGRGAGP